MYQGSYKWLAVTAWVVSMIMARDARSLAMDTVQQAGNLDGESDVWELKPYRIKILLVPDWSPAWTDQRLERMARTIHERVAVEIGRPWQITVEAAPRPLRRIALNWNTPGHGGVLGELPGIDGNESPHSDRVSNSAVDISDFELHVQHPLLALYRDADKVVLLFSANEVAWLWV